MKFLTLIKNKKNIIFLISIFLLALFLRFFRLTQNPPSLYWEEVALGYDAFSLLKTGKDHRGNSWPLVYIDSYMDYKPPLYVYVLLPSVLIFGLNEFAVRFPSAFFGSLTVLFFYFLIKELFKKETGISFNCFFNFRKAIAFFSSFLLAVSPWHLQFSRPAFEANLSLFLIILGILYFLKSLSNNKFLFFSAIFFSLSLYSYHGARVFVFLILPILIIIYFKNLLSFDKKILFLSFFLALIISFPFLNSFKKGEIRQRFQETSLFTTLEPIIESNVKIAKDNYSIFSRLFHHRIFEYIRLFLKNYSSYFTFSFLFLTGDYNPRHSIQEFGHLYHFEIITLFLGIIYVLKYLKKKSHQLIVFWLLLGFIPGAITKASPHALRTIFSLPPLLVISSLGLNYLFSKFKNGRRKIFLSLSFSIFFLELILYLHFYYFHYPIIYSQHWQYGYKEVIEYIVANREKYDNIFLTDKNGRAYMYYLFYSKENPSWVQKEIYPFRKKADVLKLGKIYFKELILLNGRKLLIGGEGELSGSRLVKIVNFLNGETAFEIWED